MKYTYRHTRRACYTGYITQAIVNNLAPILFVIFQDQYDISLSMIGKLIFLNFGTQLVVDGIAVKYVDKIGYRGSAMIGHVASALGLIMLGVLPQVMTPQIGLIIAVMTYAIGGGLIEVLISPIIEALPSDKKSSDMSLLHSFYCWGQVMVVLCSTIALKIIGTESWFVLPIIWSVIPICNVYVFAKVPIVPVVSEEEKLPIKELLHSNVFVIFLILMVTAGASEQAMSQWSSLFAEKGLEVPKVLGDILGPCLFAVLMGIGRTIYGIYGHKMNLKKSLLSCATLCIICYGVTALVQIPIISLLSCAFCGLSVSLMWPGLFSLCSERFPTGGTAMFGILAICGDLGCSLGPWLAGTVSEFSQKHLLFLRDSWNLSLSAEQFGLKTGILASLIFPLIMLIGVVLLGKVKQISIEE